LLTAVGSSIAQFNSLSEIHSVANIHLETTSVQALLLGGAMNQTDKSSDSGLAMQLILELDDSTTQQTKWEIRVPTVVGREGADIIISHGTLSRRHILLTPQLGYCSVEDLSSRNGTAVNGVLLGSEPVILHDGDLILLAGAVQFRFVDPKATPVAPRLGKLVGLWIDPDTKQVWIDAQQLSPPLSSHQQRLLEFLYEANGEVVSRDKIVSAVWPNSAREGISEDAVESLLKRLRKRLSALESEHPVIEVVRGRGLRISRNST